MKQKLLLVAFILISFFSFAQVEGPPPPCGYSPVYLCDNNNDGFRVFNLLESLPFYFCITPSEEDYDTITYYESEEDMENETNPILNPEVYTNISNPQTIYYRANRTFPSSDSSIYNALTYENIIGVNVLSTDIPNLEVFDYDSGELNVFDLTSVNVFCGSQNVSDYTITYFTSFSDVNSNTNQIENPSTFLNTVNPQTIFVRAEHNTTEYVETTLFELQLLTTVANNVNQSLCLETSMLDLSQFNSEVLGSQDPDGFTVTYYNSELDAEMEVNPLPQFVDTIDFDKYAGNTVGSNTYFSRVEENIYHSYDIGEVYVIRSILPVAKDPTPLEICDDEIIDGFTTFDLNSKTLEIINGQEETSIVYFLTLEAAENYPLSENIPYNFSAEGMSDFINTIPGTQTIYAILEDLNLVCISNIVALDLIVKDCTNSGVIEVNAFHDADTNGTFETNENLFTNGVFTYEANNDGIQRQVSSSTGSFTIISDDDTNTYDISYSLLDEYADCYEVTTTSIENVSAANGDRVIYNFPITSENSCNDIAVYLVSYESPRPGFDYLNRLVIENKGITPVASGSVAFTYDALVTFNNVSGVSIGNTVTNTGTGFVLDFVDLQPNESESVTISMNVPIPTPLGTLLNNTATYSVNDLNIENNTSTLSEIVIGSYDPNDIAESHGPEILHDSFNSEDYLYYTVRFQNVGTADAINVSIDNTLDSRLDKSTIQMLNSSHSNVFTRTDDQLNWQFDNIHLPSEDMDEPASHGYVYYKIKPMAGYSVGDIIPNTAEIYFDFNPAVITNTFQTEFTEESTLSNANLNDIVFSIFPNPTNDFISLNFAKKINDSVEINIYDIQGKPVYVNTFKSIETLVRMDVSKLSKGMYFIKVNDGDSETIKKLIVK